MRWITLVSAVPVWLVSTVSASEAPPNDTGALRLGEFVRHVQEENPAVRAAQSALEAARAGHRAADQPLHNPVLELEAENAAETTALAGLSQAIDWSDKRAARSAIAELEQAAAEAELVSVRRQVAAEVLTALARYQTARDLRKLAVRRTRLMREFAAATERRRAAGDVSGLDAALGQAAQSEARIRQGQAEAALIEDEAALRAVSGLALADWPSLPEELPLPPASMDADALLGELPALVVLQQRAAAARAGIELARRERRPDPTLGVRAGREGDDNLLGLRLEIPLFVRNPFRAEVQVASQQALQAEQQFLDARRRARARLEGALARYRATAAAWLAWQETGQGALEQQVDLLERLWKAGELSATDYLVQARQNVDTQAVASELAGDLWQSVFDWLDASGRIESWLETHPANSD